MRGAQRAGFVPVHVLKMGSHSALGGAMNPNTLSTLDTTSAETAVSISPLNSLMYREQLHVAFDIEVARFT